MYTSPNGKSYIGQTTKSLIKSSGKRGKLYRNKRIFYKAILKYGFENFDVEILGEFKKELLYKIVESFIEQYNTTIPNGYNIHGEAISSRFND